LWKLELIAETWIYSNNNFSKSYLQRNVKNLQRDDQLEQFKNLILTGLSGLSFPHSHVHRFIISFSHFGNVGDSYLRSCILRWISQAILKWNISYNSSVETGIIIFVKIWWNIELNMSATPIWWRRPNIRWQLPLSWTRDLFIKIYF